MLTTCKKTVSILVSRTTLAWTATAAATCGHNPQTYDNLNYRCRYDMQSMEPRTQENCLALPHAFTGCVWDSKNKICRLSKCSNRLFKDCTTKRHCQWFDDYTGKTFNNDLHAIMSEN